MSSILAPFFEIAFRNIANRDTDIKAAEYNAERDGVQASEGLRGELEKLSMKGISHTKLFLKQILAHLDNVLMARKLNFKDQKLKSRVVKNDFNFIDNSIEEISLPDANTLTFNCRLNFDTEEFDTHCRLQFDEEIFKDKLGTRPVVITEFPNTISFKLSIPGDYSPEFTITGQEDISKVFLSFVQPKLEETGNVQVTLLPF